MVDAGDGLGSLDFEIELASRFELAMQLIFAN
jgi:hypothetical protein